MKPDYRAMYFHSAGQLATTVDVLDTTVKMMRANVTASADTASALQSNIIASSEIMQINSAAAAETAKALQANIQAAADAITALEELTEKIKATMLKTEEMFIEADQD